MKQFLFLTFLSLVSQIVNGQACGIYRIEYQGSIKSSSKKILNIQLPSTLFLHGYEDDSSENAFIETTLTNGKFKNEIISHLTEPINDIKKLISLYKKNHNKFIMKVSYLEDNSIKSMSIELDWNEIELSIVKDEKFGTLFRFEINSISI